MGKKTPDTTLEPIERLDLSTVNRLRERFAKALSGAAVAAGISIGAGHVAGDYVQGEYRESTGYDPDQTVEVEKAPPVKADYRSPEKKDAPEGWLEKAKREAKERLDKAKNWAKEETTEESEKIEIVREYKETVRELKELKRKVLKTGDKIAYCLPFLLTFLAAIKLTLLTLSARQRIRQFIDPERLKKLDATEAKVNEMIERINHLSKTMQENDKISAETRREIETLSAEFAETSQIIEKAGLFSEESA